MFVKTLMVTKDKLTTVSPKNTLKKALDLMNEQGFLSIPVLDGNKFYGSLSKESVYALGFEKSVKSSDYLTDFSVESLMRTNVPVISPLDQVEQAAHFLEVKNVSFVAVVDDYGVFDGIVTHNAIFHEFTEVFGLNKGSRLAVIAYDIPGQISKLSRIISENNGDIISFVVIDPKSVTEVKEIVVRMRTDDFDLILDKVKEAGFKVQ